MPIVYNPNQNIKHECDHPFAKDWPPGTVWLCSDIHCMKYWIVKRHYEYYDPFDEWNYWKRISRIRAVRLRNKAAKLSRSKR